MEIQGNALITDALALRLATGADPTQIAEAIVSTWREIDSQLAPILGQGGVTALYHRSVFLAARSHPWLGSQNGTPAPVDASALQALLSLRSSAEAADAGGAVLLNFHELLTRLVGPSLTERLLRPVWTNLSSGLPA